MNLPSDSDTPRTLDSDGQRSLFWPAVAVSFGVSVLLILGVGVAFIVGRQGGPNPDGSSTQASTTASPTSTANLTFSTPTAYVMEPLAVELSVAPPDSAVNWSLQMQDNTTWETLGTANVGSGGVAQFTFSAPSVSGDYTYRAALLDEQGKPTAVSDLATLEVLRLVTDSLTASWPERPADHCSSVAVPVLVNPPAERAVILQVSNGQQAWADVATSTTDAGGRAQMRTPRCGDDSSSSISGKAWRVVAPESPAFEPATSKRGKISWCPAPQPLRATARFNEFSPTSIDVTNPSSVCAAFVNLGAEFICSGVDSPEGFLPIGYRQSTPPMLVGPGQTRIFEPAAVFTDSERRCRDFDPAYTVYVLPDTVEAWAEYFTAP